MMQLPPMMGPPPPPGVLSQPVQQAQQEPAEHASLDESGLEVEISNLSLVEQAEVSPKSGHEEENVSEAEKAPSQAAVLPAISQDLFNLYSLSFLCKSKDLSERRIKLDFGLVGEVSRVRGQVGRLE